MAKPKTIKAITLAGKYYPETIELANQAAALENRTAHDLCNLILIEAFSAIIEKHNEAKPADGSAA